MQKKPSYENVEPDEMPVEQEQSVEDDSQVTAHKVYKSKYYNSSRDQSSSLNITKIQSFLEITRTYINSFIYVIFRSVVFLVNSLHEKKNTYVQIDTRKDASNDSDFD